MSRRSIWLICVVLCLLAASSPAATIGPPKRPYQDREDDRPCEHTEAITEGRHSYSVPFRGTIDGTMTRMPVGYAAFVQGWQPNRSVKIENVGQSNVRNPWLAVNNRGDWRSLESIVAEATRGWTEPADRARAIWEFVRRQRFHACTWDEECSDALKALNVYGYTLCGNQARVLDDLWQVAGLNARRGYPIGHVIGEVFYDSGYHMLDSDEHVICLERDNHTIASAEAIVRDHDLVKRTHTYGIGHADSRRTDEFSASLYVYEGERTAVFSRATRHSMDLVLRPGESIEFRWDHIGKQYTAGLPIQEGQPRHDGLGDLRAGWGEVAYDNLRNGRLRYCPDLSDAIAREGVESSENVVFDTKALRLRAESPDRPAHITWRFASPYVFVGGRAVAAIEQAADGSARWHYSTDGKTWTNLVTANDARPGQLAASLDEVVSPRGKPTYEFFLRLSLRGSATAKDIVFENDIQTATLGLPELVVGENQVVYTDESEAGRKVRVTHQWLERTAWHPPGSTAAAESPPDAASVEGTRVSFRWTEPTDPDGDAIVDYYLELSEYPDMRWPLSPNFEKRISLTPFKGRAEWTIPYAGLLNPDTTYYWRIRALDATGVWGAWSPTFRFRCRAPGVPLDLRLAPDEGGLTLHWTANPQGRPAVAWKVYGSDERGFTASDNDYQVFRGKGFVRTIEEYESKPADAPDAGMVTVPSNLLARTDTTQARVVGADLTLPNANRAFYRVVAVDEAGNESGPSDYAQVPRPYVYTQPPAAKVGRPYTYAVGVIRSIGDLRCRRSPSSSYNAAFWDRDVVTLKAAGLPEGLSLDEQTAVVTGVPKQAGSFELTFEVATNSGASIFVRQRLHVEP